MNNYQQAIDIISDEAVNFKAVCIEVAKRNPAALIAAHKKLKGVTWQEECESVLRKGGASAFINAIRLCRNRTGLGLKESKDEIDKIRFKLGIPSPA